MTMRRLLLPRRGVAPLVVGADEASLDGVAVVCERPRRRRDGGGGGSGDGVGVGVGGGSDRCDGWGSDHGVVVVVMKHSRRGSSASWLCARSESGCLFHIFKKIHT